MKWGCVLVEGPNEYVRLCYSELDAEWGGDAEVSIARSGIDMCKLTIVWELEEFW
jgi:hypothetical protein